LVGALVAERMGEIAMNPDVRNFLYRNPQHYELVYPEAGDDTPAMCRRMFGRFLPRPPASILDVGCGTGRDLASLSRDCADCRGVDAQPSMIQFARRTRPGLPLEVGDMRAFRLGRTFDAILCLGSTFMYALTNADVQATLETFAVHARAGTLLVLDVNNAAGYLPGGSFQEVIESRVDVPGLRATVRARHSFDRRRQLLIRSRTWTIEGREEVEDWCEYRLFFPAELEQLLSSHGFRVAGMFDDKELRDSDLAGPRLYVAAIRGDGEPRPA
jgi:SAM-dependent methyltransferase